jgi:toxin YoeB
MIDQFYKVYLKLSAYTFISAIGSVYPSISKATNFIEEAQPTNVQSFMFTELYSGVYLNNLNADEIAQSLKNGIAAKLRGALIEANDLFRKVALHGNVTGMYWLGLLHEEKGEIVQALKWYIQGIQEHWLLSQQPHSLIKSRLDNFKQHNQTSLLETPVNAFLQHYQDSSIQGFWAHYPPQKRALIPSLARLDAAYNSRYHEPYLDQYENHAKARRFNQLGYLAYNTMVYNSPEMWLGLGGLCEEGGLGDPIDIDKAIKCYERANSSDAYNRLAAIWEDGRLNGKPEFQKAEEYYIKSNTPEGWFNLGLFYAAGRGSNGIPNYSKAADAYRKSNTPEAWVNLGLMYEDGKIGKKPNYIEAKNCYEKAQTSEAWHNLGILYSKGKIGKKPDYKNAERCYLRANYPTSSYNLGGLYRDGKINGKREYMRAKAAFEKSQIPDAWESLGKLYEEGKLTPEPDYKKAESFYKKADTPNAWFGIGLLHLNGKLEGKADNVKAKECFFKSGTPEALHSLGLMYLQGKIESRPNYKEALRYFLESNSPAALYNIGLMYEEGVFTGNPDFQKAAEFYEKSNDCNSLCNLGVLHALALLNQNPDYNKAAFCFEKSNTPDGWHNLGRLYFTGKIGSSPDYKQAKHFFEKAKMPDSFIMIGMLYEEGKIDGKPDPQQARNYYQKADTPTSLQMLLNLQVEGLIALSSDEETRINQEIKQKLDDLPEPKKAYQTGQVAYLKDEFEEAYTLLNQALLNGAYVDEAQIEYIASLIYLNNMLSLFQHLDLKEKQEAGDLPSFSPSAEAHIQAASSESVDAFHPLESSCSNQVRRNDSTVALSPLVNKENAERKLQNLQSNSHGRRFKNLNVIREKLEKKKQKVKELFLKFKSSKSPSIPSDKSPVEIEVKFINEKTRNSFYDILNDNKHIHHNKLKRIYADIRQHPWLLQGEGQPEILKNKYQGFKGCYSRRMDAANRLIYKIEAKSILILSCEGHYE